LEAQRHRRVIKTHTPIDGIPLDARPTYVVIARNPLDAAVSLYHQGNNIDRERLQELTGNPPPRPSAPKELAEWLRTWIDEDTDPFHALDSLPGVLWHLSDAWSRRDDRNVVLLRYEDLLADLDGQMRRLADRLEIDVPDDLWDALVEAASFRKMRLSAARVAPDAQNVLRDPVGFFRSGTSGEGARVLGQQTLARYHRRAATLAPADLLVWLHS
jgi:hypothetical protein